LKKLTNGFPATVYDYGKTYSDLVFPVVTGTYYNNSQLCISLNLKNKNSSGSRISYNVETEFKDCDITVVFVPTEEIGRILYKYRNSILKFNPRCYLEMQANSVNKEIYKTIKERKTNEFALFNNGITMLSDETLVNEKIGQKDKAQIVIKNPQIINGGQTAYTLSRIYDEVENRKESIDIFQNKEVLLKIITFGDTAARDESAKLTLIEDISKATNKQSAVSDADRRSNDKIQIELQRRIFESFGFYYERKKGEYADGIREKYITRDLIIDRETLLRLAMSCDGLPAQARRTSSKRLFQEENFRRFMNDPERHSEYFYAYICYMQLHDIERELSKYKDDRFGTTNYGQGVRYGKFAVISVCCALFSAERDAYKNTKNHVLQVLANWLDFEKYAIGRPMNYLYFRVYTEEESSITTQELNFEGYYKGR
ncbi:AIPR family protein, partial [Pseudomonas sp. SST3]|uniref:AIPR family protein n=1 Tax=Pseudomonas sp. SST3 TaxID=2267882 RepID=UPI001580389E